MLSLIYVVTTVNPYSPRKIHLKGDRDNSGTYGNALCWISFISLQFYKTMDQNYRCFIYCKTLKAYCNTYWCSYDFPWLYIINVQDDGRCTLRFSCPKYGYLLEITNNCIGGATIDNDCQEGCRGKKKNYRFVRWKKEPLTEILSNRIINSYDFGHHCYCFHQERPWQRVNGMWGSGKRRENYSIISLGQWWNYNLCGMHMKRNCEVCSCLANVLLRKQSAYTILY